MTINARLGSNPLPPGRYARQVVVKRLAALSPLDEGALRLLSSMEGEQTNRGGAELVSERQPMIRPRFLVRGWAARVRSLPDGRRQILGFILPGDGLNLCHRPHPLALGGVVALTQVETLDARSLNLGSLAEVSPALEDALHVSASLHEAYLLNQVLRLGRLTAYERICHLFLEFRDRLKLVGLASDDRLPMPLTQEVLADANGLSTVHVNRVLQQLRRDRMLELKAGQVLLLDPEAMAAAGDYSRPEASRWRGTAAFSPRP